MKHAMTGMILFVFLLFIDTPVSAEIIHIKNEKTETKPPLGSDHPLEEIEGAPSIHDKYNNPREDSESGKQDNCGCDSMEHRGKSKPRPKLKTKPDLEHLIKGIGAEVEAVTISSEIQTARTK